MSYLKLPELKDLQGEVRELAEDAVNRWSYFPNIERAYALAPEVMKAEDVWSKGVMYHGFLPRSLKEAIATVVSSTNECQYCASIHAYANTITGTDTEKATSCSHFDFSKYSSREQLALEFTRKATSDPKSIIKEDIERLKQEYNEGEIVEICAVIQQFMGYNWFVTILGLQVEKENPIKLSF